jgi:hypothetical protein
MNETPAPQPYDPGPDAKPPHSGQPSSTPQENRSAMDMDRPLSQPKRENWIWGIILIILGGLFLLQNFSTFHLLNWWAIFILIPAAGSFVTAWRNYQASGRLTSSARSSLFGGVIFTTVAIIFLLNLDLGRWWPVFLVAAGLAVVINALFPD